jgi:predicted amidohydrolase YtcJ
MFAAWKELAMRVRVFVVFSMLAATIAGSAQRRPLNPPDAVFVNGKIVTVDERFSTQQAFAVRGDRFVAVGTNADIRALAVPTTRVVDLLGRTVIPGLTDNHDHVYSSAKVMLRGVSMDGVTSTTEALERIRDAVAKAKPGDIVFTSALPLPPNAPGPTIRDLDRISTQIPIVVVRGRRGNAQLNTAALARAAITKDTTTFGGKPLLRDANGVLTGAETGSTTDRFPVGLVLLDAVIPPMSDDEEETILKKALARRNELGLTSLRDLTVFPAGMRAYFRLWRKNQLSVRVSLGMDLPDADHFDETLAAWGVGSGFGDAWLRLDSISEDPTPTVVDARKFTAIALTANRYGWRLAPHLGDEASLNITLDAYEAADRASSIRDKRWVVEHAANATPAQMDRLARLGVMVSASVNRYYANIPAEVDAAQRARLERQPPVREFLDHRLVVTAGSDYFAGPGSLDNPFISFYFFVTRRNQTGQLVGPLQKITREEALRVLTVNYAYTTYDEGMKGSIQPGMLADFLILSNNLLTVPDDQILSVHPLATYVGGRRVFAMEGSGF